jgi:hypothetical protein
MEARDYIVSFRRGKSMEDLKAEDGMLLADYCKALGLTVVDVYPTEESVRINATDKQLAPLWEPLGSVCHIVIPVVGHARVAGTS